jgi:hypothetical protein
MSVIVQFLSVANGWRMLMTWKKLYVDLERRRWSL